MSVLFSPVQHLWLDWHWADLFPKILFMTKLAFKNISGDLFEAKKGPYNAGTDKTFANWSPAEGSAEVSG